MSARIERRLAAILAADVVGYSLYLPVYHVLFPWCDWGSPIAASFLAGGITGSLGSWRWCLRKACSRVHLLAVHASL